MEENKIYSFLKENNLTGKSEQDFNAEYSNPENAKKLYSFFQENNLTAKDFDSFYQDNFKSVQPDTTDYGPFDKATVEKYPQAQQNFERWQNETNGKLQENEVTSPDGDNKQVNIPLDSNSYRNFSPQQAAEFAKSNKDRKLPEGKHLSAEEIAAAKAFLPQIDKMISSVDIPKAKTPDYRERNFGMYAGSMYANEKPEERQARETAITTKNVLEKTKDYYEAVANGDAGAASKFWSGLKTFDLQNTLTLGIKDMAGKFDIYDAAKNFSEGKATPQETNLLIAQAMLEEIQSTAQKDRAISVGSGLSEMAPWLAQFAATGGFGTSAVNATTKALGNSLAAKITARLVGSAAQTAAQVPMMAQGTAERMTDRYALDDTGRLKIQEKGEGFGEALLRTYANNYLENVSERGIGDAVDKLAKKGVNSFLKSKTFGKTYAADLINWARKNPYIKVTNRTLGLNTPLSENIEEAFTGLTQPFVTEDNWKDIQKGVSEYFTGENLYRTFLTTAAMGAGMGLVQAPGQIYHTARSEQGRKLVEEAFDEQANGLFYSAATAETVEEREKYWEELVRLTGMNAKELNPVMHYYQTVLTQIENGIDPRKQAEIIQPEVQPESTQLTVDPRQAQEAKTRQFAESLANKETGTIQTVELVLPEGTNNTHWFVKGGSFDDVDGSILVEDDAGNQKLVTRNQIAGDIQEIKLEDFVSQSMQGYDQNQLAQQNKMIRNGRTLVRMPEEGRTIEKGFETENGFDAEKGFETWIDEDLGQGVEVPLEEVQAWEQAKNANPNATPDVVSRVYGKTEVSGIKDGNGGINLVSPMAADQANNLKAEVEAATAGKATVIATPADESDPTNPLYNVSIVPIENITNDQTATLQTGTGTDTQSQAGTQVNNDGTGNIQGQSDQLSNVQPQLTYPLDKNGNPDIDKMDEIQLFNYNKEQFGEETAIADLQGDIQLISDKIAKAEKKLATADTKTKIKTRLEIKTLTDQRNKLQQLIPVVNEEPVTQSGKISTEGGNETPQGENQAQAKAEPTKEQVLAAEIKQLEKDLPFVLPNQINRYKQQIEAKKAELEALLNPKPEVLETPELTPEQKTGRINRLLDEAKWYDEIPRNHTKKRQAAVNSLRNLAEKIGYSVGLQDGKTVIFDENNQPVTKKIAVKTSQEDIQAHNALADYSPEVQEVINWFTDDINRFNMVVMYNSGNGNPSNMKNIQSAINNIKAGNKTVAANNLLDDIEAMINSGGVSFTDGFSAPLDEFMAMWETETDIYWNTIVDKNISQEELNDLFLEHENENADNQGTSDAEGNGSIGENGKEPVAGNEGNQPEVEETTEEGAVDDFDYESIFGGIENDSPRDLAAEKEAALEKEYQDSKYSKKWAATRKEAIEKLTKQFNDAKAKKAEWQNKVYKKNGGSVEVGKDNDFDINNVSIDYINEKRRQEVIRGAETDMKEALDDLKTLKVPKEQIDKIVNNFSENEKKLSENEIQQPVNQQEEEKTVSESEQKNVISEKEIEKSSPKEANNNDFFVTRNRKGKFFETDEEFELTSDELSRFDEITNTLYPKEVNRENMQPYNKAIKKWQKSVIERLSQIPPSSPKPIENQAEPQAEKVAIDNEIAAQNPNTNPTEGQKEAGNYKKAHIIVNGLDITIENPKGSIRSGKDEDGKIWEHEMKSHYGYFKRTEGKDGDQIDVFVGEQPESGKIFVIDQNDPKTGNFDESKVMMGYNSAEEAKAAYLENYDKDWKGFSQITEVDLPTFTTWLNDGKRQRKPFGDYKNTPAPVNPNQPAIDKLKSEIKGLQNDIKRKEKEINERNSVFGDIKTIGEKLGTQPFDVTNAKKVIDGYKAEISRKEKEIETLAKAGETGAKEAAAQQELVIPEEQLKIVVVPNGSTSFDKQAQLYIKSFLSSVKVKDKLKFSGGKLDYDLFALMNDDGDIISLHKTPKEVYAAALNNDIEYFNIVREKKEGKTLTYDYYTGGVFGDAVGELYESDGRLKESVKQAVIDEINEHFKFKEPATPKVSPLEKKLAEAERKQEDQLPEAGKKVENPILPLDKLIQEGKEKVESSGIKYKGVKGEEQTPVENPVEEITTENEQEIISKIESEQADESEQEEDVLDDNENGETLEKLQDFGVKIGAARKDTAQRGYKMTPNSIPGWARKFNIGQFHNEDTWTITIPQGTYYRTLGRGFKTKEEAYEALPLIAVSLNHRVYQNRDGKWSIFRKWSSGKQWEIKGGFDTRDEAMKYMAENAVDIITKRSPVIERPHLDKIKRNRKDWRNGKNVTPEQFLEKFGFRGGEFGNWLASDERQSVLNMAYDAFMDMSELLGISPRALSMKGELSIGFGSRGHGLQGAAAHYEKERAVINLTRINGAGSLAHEWFHALDNYLAKLDGKSSSVRQEDGTFKQEDRKFAYFSHGESTYPKTKMRNELLAAFKEIMNEINTREVIKDYDIPRIEKQVQSATEDFENRINEIRNTGYRAITKQRDYGIKKKPATPEQLKRFDELVEKIRGGEIGQEKWYGSAKSFGKGKWMYETEKELSDLVKDITGKEPTYGYGSDNTGFLYSAINRIKRSGLELEKAKAEGQYQTRIKSLFKSESEAIDQSRSGSYWASPHEMAARAFEAFLEDETLRTGESQYLVYGARNIFYAIMGVKPYPEGQERVNIDNAFRKFFDTIQEKTEGDKTVLYEPATNYGNNRTLAEQQKEWEDETATRAEEGKAQPKPAIQTQIEWGAEALPFDNKSFSDSPETSNVQREANYSPEYDTGITWVERQLSDLGQITFMGEKLTGPAKIKSANDVAFLFKNLESAATENAFVVHIKKNGEYKVQYLATGSTSGVILDIKQVVLAAKEFGAEKVCFVHNHPSGTLVASKADYQLSKMLQESLYAVGIKHEPSVIIDTDKGKFAIINNDWTQTDVEEKQPIKGKIEPKNVYQFDRQKLYKNAGEKTLVSSSASVAEFLSKQKRGTTNKIHVMILDRGNNITRYYLVDETTTTKELISRILPDIGKHGDNVILASNGVITAPQANEIKRAVDKLGAGSLLDVIHIKQNANIISNYRSFADDGILYEPKSEYDKVNNLQNVINTNTEEQADNRRKQPDTGTERRFAIDTNERQKLDEGTAGVVQQGDNGLGREKIEFSQPSTIGFYSPTERALEQIQQNKGTVEQFKAMLLKNGAKQAELDWMGWDEFAKANPTMTKADIQEWIDQNKVEVEEVQKGTFNPRAVNKSDVKSVRFKQFGSGSYVVSWNDPEIGDIEISTNEAIDEEEAIDAAIERANYDNTEYRLAKPKYSQYQLPGGENYKEVLLTMPNKTKVFSKEDYIYELIKKYGLENEPYDILYFKRAIFTQEEVDKIKSLPSAFEGERLGKPIDGSFKSSHWDEPNILAHIRFNERTDSEGNKVLFIEEIQSDWAQKGKKEGFADSKEEQKIKDRIKEIEKRREEMINSNPSVKAFSDYNNQLKKKYGEYFTKTALTEDEFEKLYKLKQERKSSIDESKEYKELGDELQKLNQYSFSNIPDMPFKQTPQWVNLTLRRIIRYASENGFDRIAWTNGEQQAERYDLSKQVDEIDYKKRGDGKYTVQVRKGDNNIWGKKEATISEIEDTVGKEIASKIQSQATDELQTLSGLDLKVGGSGMKAFYNSIVPNAAKEIGKKFGAKVEPVTLNFGNDINNETGEYLKDNEQQVLSIPVTPGMHETAIREGMPLFKYQPFIDKLFNRDPKGEIKKVLTDLQNKAGSAANLVLGDNFEDMIKKFEANGASKSKVEYIKQKGQRANAFYDVTDGTVYINLSRITTKDEAIAVWVHETGWHHGVRNLVPETELDALFEKIYDSVVSLSKTDGKLRDIVTHVETNYKGTTKATRGNEMAAKLAEKITNDEDLSPVERSLWNQVKDWVRQMLRKWLNFNSGLLTEKQLAQLIKSAVQSNFQGPEDGRRRKGKPEFAFLGETGAANLDKAEEATTRLDNLKVAREMETAKNDAKTIKLATGWERGADGKWRYEVPDGKVLNKNEWARGKLKEFDWKYSTFNQMFEAHPEIKKEYDEFPDILDGKTHKLKDVYLASKLYSAYPELENVNIVYKQTVEKGASYNPRTKTIELNDVIDVNSTIAHEIQHYIQDVSGFASGGNLISAKSTLSAEEQVELSNLIETLPELEALMNDAEFGTQTRRDAAKAYVDAKNRIEELSPKTRYNRLAGEVESRNVQTRMNYTPEQRRQTLAEETEDVSRKDQIFLNEALGEARLESESIPETITFNVKPRPTISPVENKKAVNQLVPGNYKSDVKSQVSGEFKGKNGQRYYISKDLGSDFFRVYNADIYDNWLSGKADYIDTDVASAWFNTDAFYKKDKFFTGATFSESIQVKPEHRRNGVATAIIDFAKSIYKVPYRPSSVLSADMRQFLSSYMPEFIPEQITVAGKERPTRNSKGQFIHPTLEGIKNFWKWFGESKVTDEQGRPLVVYHGTGTEFNEFMTTRRGIWLTPDETRASGYARGRKGGEEGIVMPLYAKIENPSSSEYNDDYSMFYTAGFDGWMSKKSNGEFFTIVVKNPIQIKSATGNIGAFDEENPNINFSLGSPLEGLLANARIRYADNKTGRRSLSEVMNGVRQFYQDTDLPIRDMEEEIKRLGGTQKDSQKPYRDMNLSFGRMEDLYKAFTEDKMKPVLKTITKIAKTGMSTADILPYVIAKHATERNPYMRAEELKKYQHDHKNDLAVWKSRNQEATDEQIESKKKEIEKEAQKKEKEIENKDYSGVMGFNMDENGEIVNPLFENDPDGLAAAIAEEFESKVPEALVDELWSNIKNATNEILTAWEAGTMVSPEDADNIRNRYKYYVPLRGWKDGAAKQLHYIKGEGFAKSLQKANGRKSFADNPLAYINKVMFQALGEQVDSEVKRSVYNLVVGNYAPEFKHIYELKRAYYVKTTLDDGTEGWMLSIDPETGEIVKPSEEMFASGQATTKIYNQHERLRTPTQSREHEVLIKTTTGDRIIVFKGRYLPVAQALNRQNRMYVSILSRKVKDAGDWNGPVVNTIGNINNFIKANLTSKNIVFPFTNILRDIPEAALTAYIKGESGVKVVANIPFANAAFMRDLAGTSKPESNKYDKYLKEFREAGGPTGYTHQKDIEQIKKDMDKMLRRMSRAGGKRILNAWSGAGKAIETWSDIFETTTRLAVFISSRELGKSVKDAASDAKEYSVNFNRKGKITKSLDAVWAFFNVSVQSLQKNGSLAIRYPKRFAIVASSFMMMGFLEALINDMFSGDGDDDDYYNVNEYVRQNYLIIPAWGEKYVRLPLPQFWRSFKSFGTIIYDTFRHDINLALTGENVENKMNGGHAAIKALGNFVASLTPIDLGGLYVDGEINLSPIAPTVVKPWAELAENKNYMGYSIAKEPFTKEQEKMLAKSGLYKNDVNPAIRFFTDYLAKTAGKDGETKYYREDGESKKISPLMDINPSQIDHIVKGYLGGTYKFLSDIVTTASQAVSEEEDVDFNNIPFVNSFIRKTPEAKWRTIQQYYDLKTDDGFISFDALKREFLKKEDKSQYIELATDNYLNKYSAIMSAADKKLDAQMKAMDYKTAEGNEAVLETMSETIEKINALKKEYKIK